MWLDGTRYPTPDERPAVGVLQWIQFQLDNCATIDDVIAGDKIIRIASQGTTPLHYLVADANGQAATIEFFDGKMTVHKGDQLPYPVLTNDTYASSVELVNKTGTSGKSFTGNNSQQRFLEACSRVTDLKQNKVPVTSLTDYSFQILNTVAQGSYTRWSIVYDITNKKILFKTNRYPQIKQVSFSDIDFTCSSVPKGFDMNQDLQGDIVPFMKDFTIELNQRIVETAFRESGDQINASTKDIEAQWKYAGEVKCPSLRQ
jgi:choloylglycine hydrolase